MRLIDGQRLPLDLAELASIAERKLVRREQHVELELLRAGPKLVLADHLARWCGPDVHDHVQVRRPSRELGLPGGDRRERDDDEEGAVLLHLVEQVREE